MIHQNSTFLDPFFEVEVKVDIQLLQTQSIVFQYKDLRLREPLSPQNTYQKTVKARKINDLRAFFIFRLVKIFNKNQSLRDQFGYPKIRKYRVPEFVQNVLTIKQFKS